MNSVIYGGKSWGVGTEKLTEVDTSGGGEGVEVKKLTSTTLNFLTAILGQLNNSLYWHY